jgi:predicted acyltransferase
MPDIASEKHTARLSESRPKTNRLVSVDALRGFDMFWIIGGGGVVHAIHAVCGGRFTGFLSRQLDHCEWRGFHFEDLILPLFLFLVGVSLVFSLGRIIEKEGRRGALIRVFRRSLLLFLLGLFYYGGVRGGWQEIRWSGVLQRIALAYCGAGLLFCFFRPRVLAIATAALLLGYWAILAFTPMRDIRLDDATFKRLCHTAGIQNERQVFLNTTATVTGRYEQDTTWPTTSTSSIAPASYGASDTKRKRSLAPWFPLPPV